MSMENKLWDTEKFLPPQEKIMAIKEEVNETVREFLAKDPSKIKSEELYTAISRIDSLQTKAENSGDETLPQYLKDKMEELRRHKHSLLKADSREISAIKIAPQTGKSGRSKKIGTHWK